MRQHVFVLILATVTCLITLGCQEQNKSTLSQDEVDLINHQSNLAKETSLRAYAMTLAHEKEMNSTAPYSLRLDPDGQLFLIVDKPKSQVFLIDIDNNRIVPQ